MNNRIGFDNDKYLEEQTRAILQRVEGIKCILCWDGCPQGQHQFRCTDRNITFYSPSSPETEYQKAVDEFLDKFYGQGTVLAFYEAGPCGYGLARYIESKGIQCQVFAPSKIPRKPGERIKTDRRDSLKLAQLLRYGAGTPVHIFSEQDEAVRELLRYRDQVRRKAGKEKQKIRMFLLRYDRASCEHKPWTEALHEVAVRFGYGPVSSHRCITQASGLPIVFSGGVEGIGQANQSGRRAGTLQRRNFFSAPPQRRGYPHSSGSAL